MGLSSATFPWNPQQSATCQDPGFAYFQCVLTPVADPPPYSKPQPLSVGLAEIGRCLLTTHRSRRRLSQQATDLPWNLAFADAVRRKAQLGFHACNLARLQVQFAAVAPLDSIDDGKAQPAAGIAEATRRRQPEAVGVEELQRQRADARAGAVVPTCLSSSGRADRELRSYTSVRCPPLPRHGQC